LTLAVQTLSCPACGAAIDVTGVFPGGKVTCRCGVAAVVPLPRGEASASAPRTPFRTLEAPPTEATMLKCPFCGGPSAPDVRACPHCDVELASVRCPHCFTLHFTGSRFCARCGKELELEPLLDATDAPCPRCDKPLSVFGGGLSEAALDALHECTGCGGVFVSQKTLDAIIARESPGPKAPDAVGGIGAHPHVAPHVPAPPASSVRAADVVRYVKCPLCHVMMNRHNFGRHSGVIVDVCKVHGVWFDKGELTQAIEFVARGGLEESRQRAEVEAKDDLRKEAAKLQVSLMEDGMHEARAAGYLLGRHEGHWQNEHHSTLLDILFELLR